MKRRAITLLEVLFSIGVVAIGLLGVMAVIPLALRDVGKGQVADESFRVGSNARRAFRAHGHNDPLTWIRYADDFPAPNKLQRFVQVTYRPGVDGVWGNSIGGGDDDNDGFANEPDESGFYSTTASSNDTLGEYLLPGVSFCIDPRFMADPGNWTSAGAWFPYSLPGITSAVAGFPINDASPLRMMRVTLGTPGRPGSTPAAYGSPANWTWTERFFGAGDDLLFDLPQDISQPPKQSFVWTPGPDGAWGDVNVDDDGVNGIDDIGERGWPSTDDVAASRESTGAYSWLATIVPRRDHLGSRNDLYTLSVVVFQRRVLPNLSDAEADPQESIGYIVESDFHSLGYSGGDVTIRSYPTSQGGDASDLDVSAGRWLMLCGYLDRPAGTQAYSRWYRVIVADEVYEHATSTGSDKVYARDVTLEGADWPLPSLNSTASGKITRVVFLDDVVSVLESTIRLAISP